MADLHGGISYSEDFKGLISSLERARSLIEGSGCLGRGFAEWEAIRGFARHAIDRGGTILDVGAANGFFLRCLQEWVRPRRLIPFGVDIDDEAIAAARKLLP